MGSVEDEVELDEFPSENVSTNRKLGNNVIENGISWLGLWCFTPLSAIGGNRRKPLTCRKSLKTFSLISIFMSPPLRTFPGKNTWGGQNSINNLGTTTGIMSPPTF
jgi:hypothetical protein